MWRSLVYCLCWCTWLGLFLSTRCWRGLVGQNEFDLLVEEVNLLSHFLVQETVGILQVFENAVGLYHCGGLNTESLEQQLYLLVVLRTVGLAWLHDLRKVVHLSQNRKEGGYPRVSKIEHSRMLRLFQNSANKRDGKLPVLDLEAFDKNLFQVEMEAPHWLVLGDSQSTNEAAQTLEVVFDHHCSPRRNSGDCQELFLVYNHALFENQSSGHQSKTNDAGRFLDHLGGSVELSDHLDINVLQCSALRPQPLGEEVVDEPPEMHVSTARFLVLHFFAIDNFRRLLDDELLEHLDLLLEVAPPSIVADLSNAVLKISILAFNFDRWVLQNLI